MAWGRHTRQTEGMTVNTNNRGDACVCVCARAFECVVRLRETEQEACMNDGGDMCVEGRPNYIGRSIVVCRGKGQT